MSDTEGTGGSDQEEVLEFKCRKCPGKTFTAAEKDSHRQFHKQEKDKKRKPGPKSKTRTTRARDASPPASEATLFQPVLPPKAPAPGKKRGRKAKDDDAGPSRRKSRKNYDSSIVGNWSNGTGA